MCHVLSDSGANLLVGAVFVIPVKRLCGLCTALTSSQGDIAWTVGGT